MGGGRRLLSINMDYIFLPDTKRELIAKSQDSQESKFSKSKALTGSQLYNNTLLIIWNEKDFSQVSDLKRQHLPPIK